MSENTSSASILEDERAEGTMRPDESDARFVLRRKMSTSRYELDARRGPSADTGISPAIVLPTESYAYDERQDASRTTSEARAVPTQQRAPERKSSQLPTVLIVEDTAELAEMLQATLQRLPLAVSYETHGLRALARYREMKPDVMIVDIGLPDISGWKLLEAIREEVEGHAQMPVVIIITAYGDAANRLVGKLQKVDSYLVKPFTPTEVERVVQKALGGKVG